MSKHLLVAVVTLLCTLYQIEAAPKEIQDKFRAEAVVPDVIDELPEDLLSLTISYPSGVKVELGNTLTPTQVKDVPKIDWKAEEGAYYTLLLTGK